MACALALVSLALGCQQRGPGARGDAGSGSMGGVRVPLPEGWVASADGPEALVLGPPGRAVMRIERRSGGRLPRLADLRSAFSEQVEDARAITLEEREADDGVVWRARLEPAGSRGTRGPTVLLAARRLGADVLLCASIPGASDAEVEAAASACEGLSP